MASIRSPSAPVSPVQDCPQKDLLASLSALHFGGAYSDLTVTCGYRSWACHRAILCSRSGFFDGACRNGFAEANNRVIDLPDDDEEAVNQMIHFFYHLDYALPATAAPQPTVFRHRVRTIERRSPPKKVNLSLVCDPLLAAAGYYTPDSPTSPLSSAEDCMSLDQPKDDGTSSPAKSRSKTPPLVADDGSDYESVDDDDDDLSEDDSQLLLHTRVYALAEKYEIPSLKQLALRKFEQAIACHYDSPELPAAIEEVYCSTIDNDRGLRDIVCEAFRCYPQLASTQDVRAVIQELPSLALDLFKIERGIPVSMLGG